MLPPRAARCALPLLLILGCPAPSAEVGALDSSSSSTDAGSSDTGSSDGSASDGATDTGSTAQSCEGPSGTPHAFAYTFTPTGDPLAEGRNELSCVVSSDAFALDCTIEGSAIAGTLALDFPAAPLGVGETVDVTIVTPVGLDQRRGLAIRDGDGRLLVAGADGGNPLSDPPWAPELTVTVIESDCVLESDGETMTRRVALQFESSEFPQGSTATFFDGQQAVFQIGTSREYEVHVAEAWRIVSPVPDDAPELILVFGVAIRDT